MSTRDLDDLFAGKDQPVLVDNDAGVEIEDHDGYADPVEVEQNPYIHRIADNDGFPGEQPFVDEAARFDGIVEDDGRAEQAGDEVLGDEWEHRMATLQAASTGVGGGPLSDLATLHQFDQRRHQEESKLSPYVNINPESVYSAILGGQATITAAAGVSPQFQQVAQWMGKDVEAKPVTVVFSPVQQLLIPPPLGNPAQYLRPVGRVAFGVRAYSNVVDVDMARGCQFTIMGSQVTLYVGLDATPATLSQTVSMNLGGALAFYPIVRTTPLTRTLYFDPLAPGPTLPVIIPQFAKKVSLMAGSAGNITLAFNDAAVNATLLNQTAAQNQFGWNPIPIPNDASFITLNNTTGGNIVARLIFELAL